MDGTHGLDVALEVVYVLYLPPDQAVSVREKLLSHGLSESRIKTIDPIGDSRSMVATGPRGPESKRPVAENRLETGDRPSGTDGPASGTPGNGVGSTARDRDRSERRPTAVDHAALTARPRQVEAIRFLPRSVKLGTYGDGRYNVVMRRRVVPEGRETVWISMAARTPAGTTGADDQARKDARETTDGPDPPRTEHLHGGGDDGSVTITRCRCSSKECDGYKEVLRRYFVVNDRDGHGHEDGHRGTRYRPPATRCVYKKIVDVLLENEGADGGTTVDGGQPAAAAEEQTVTAADGDVHKSGSSAAREVDVRNDVYNDGDVCNDENVHDDDGVHNDDEFHDDNVHNDDDDDGHNDDDDNGSAKTAPDAASSQQVSVAERTVRPSTSSRDPSTVVTVSRAHTIAAVAGPRGGVARQVTAKKPTFFDKLLRRNKKTEGETSKNLTIRRASVDR